MAVDPLVRDFLPRFRRHVAFFASALLILTTGILAGILWLFGLFDSHINEVIIIISTVFATGLITTILLTVILTRPTKHLLATISFLADEPSDTPPPAQNKRSFEWTGFHVVIKKLYALSAERSATQHETSSEDTSRGLIAKALDETICGFVAFNESRQIIYANRAAPVRITNEGVTLLDIIFNSEGDSLEEWWNECEESMVKAERTWSRISNKLPNEEGRRLFDVVASYNKGAEAEMVLTLVDRTHTYSADEEELDFIAFAAHELRGPITVIRGYIDVLQDELDDVIEDDQKELFRRLSVSATRLAGYVNNILNTSRFDRRHLRMRLAETTVADVYSTISDDMALRAQAQNRLLSVTIPTDLPSIPADTTSLSEVFSNLIDNAIKYSNEGGAISVSAQKNGDMVDISVEDHGIGMPGNVVGNLFQKFYRSHRSRETVAGTGIGLYISKAIIESHGGTIFVKSEEGKGSTFTISLPIYQMVADKLKSGDNEGIINKKERGIWIKNHGSFRG